MSRATVIWNRFLAFTLRPILGRPSPGKEELDLYASQMLTRFNWFHRVLLPRFFSKIRVDEDSLQTVKDQMGNGIPIYVTTYVGQLEYNYFNYLSLTESLPLAKYANGLTNWQWMPITMARHTKMARIQSKIRSKGHIPHPVSSGHVENLLTHEKSIFVRLRTTRIYDDLYWEIPEEDVVQKLISVQRNMDKPFLLIPEQFLWAKRPEKTKRSIIDWAFGERDNPARLRKIILFFRNYKSHAVVQFGEPLNLKDFIDAHPGLPETELARLLRATLLKQIQQERKRITGPALKPRPWMIEKVLEDNHVEEQICQLASEREKDVQDLRDLATKYAKEIAADISFAYVEYATRILNWGFENIYDGIQTNTEGLQTIKKIAQDSPLVFVPNHRSHLDYLIISDILYRNHIVVPHVAAGINLAFWPLGKIFRRSGAFFIRRTFAGNPLYKAVFEAYIRLLIQEGYCQEFFIEGGRSRTGKLRQPRMGLLATMVQAMLSGASKDLYFIPTSITYDKVVEESIYVDESAGVEKKKEKFTDILKLTKYLKRRYGKVYVNFGEPISYRSIASGVQTNEAAEKKKEIVEKIAFNIMDTLGKEAVVTPSALVACAFLLENRPGITSERLIQNIDLLRTGLESINAQLTDTLLTESGRAITNTLHQLSSQKVIEMHQDFDPVYYAISDEGRAALDFQKNTIVHFLLPLAYTSASILTFLKRGLTECPMQEVEEQIEFLKGLFSHEFAAHQGLVTKQSFSRTLDFLVKKKAITIDSVSEKIVVTALGSDILKHYRAIIENIIDSYKIAHYTCSKIPHEESRDEKTLTKSMLQNGRHLLLLGQISRKEAISKPSFENAIQIFRKLGFLITELPDEESKDRLKYRWNRTNPATQELQQELELFS